jgi:hypothetical protein
VPSLTLPPFPQIAIPSGILPIPSVLPPFFRELPGFAPPPAASSAGAPASH